MIFRSAARFWKRSTRSDRFSGLSARQLVGAAILEFLLRRSEQEPVVFFSVNELELRKARFSVAVPPGEIDFGDKALRQVTPLEAEGTAELLGNTLGEIR